MPNNQTAASSDESAPVPGRLSADALTAERLLRLEHMFRPFADDELMRELSRIAVRCAREGLTRA